jgi:hypothetical protein
MTTCSTNRPGPFECPTLEQSIQATAALLPRGRAWPANSAGMVQNFLGWLGALVGIPAPSDYPPGYGQMGFVAAIGAVRNYLETQLCALRLEFWCATETLTNDLWMAEYGLPDDCDPFPVLCAKVAALGGRRCELYQELCEANGWIIECVANGLCFGVNSYAGGGMAGNMLIGSAPGPNHIGIVVNLEESPAFQGGAQTPFLAGRIFAGMPISCPPDINPLQCLIERIAPAHVVVNYNSI